MSQSCYSLKGAGGGGTGPRCESDSEEGPTSSWVSIDREMINGLMNVLGLCGSLAHFNSPESLQPLNLY